MRKFLWRHKGILMLISAMALIIIMFFITLLSGGWASPLTTVWNAAFSPVQRGINGSIRWIILQYNKTYDFQRLSDENAALRIQIAEMDAQIRESIGALEENARLRILHGMSERRRDLTFATAMIIERPVNTWQSAFKIDKGENKGLTPGMCVVNEEGFFVGVIAELGPNWATVNTLIDPGVEIGAIVSRTDEIAVAAGQFNAMHDGLLRLNYLPANTTVRTGDTILTSGVNSMYPSGLVLGVVEGIFQEGSGVGIYATVRPKADLASLSHLFIITSFDVEN
jgi:rod shape-determining protein MreC